MFAVDAVPGSDEWVVDRLATKLGAEHPRLSLLHEHHEGTVTVPDGGNGSMRDSYARFLNLARLNLARVIVGAVTDRWRLAGFVASPGSSVSDVTATALWRRVSGPMLSSLVLEDVAVYGRGYGLVGRRGGRAALKHLSPWTTIADAPEGEPWNAISALHLSHLPTLGVDQVTLWRVVDGRVYSRRAQRPTWASTIPAPFQRHARWYPGRGWEWVEAAQPIDWTAGRLPVIPLAARGGKGQFEPHLDTLDRINHQIFQRLTITVMQAFRQRAIKGLPQFYPEGHPQAGEPIDYRGLFEAGPAAMWQLPGTADIWESQVTDVGPLRMSIADDVKHLLGVSKTPLYMVTSDAQNGSAEGASLMREGLVYKVEDLQAFTTGGIEALLDMALSADGAEHSGTVSAVWAAADRSSIEERAQAASQAASTLPERTAWREIYRFSPEQIAQIERDQDAEMFLGGAG